MCGRYSIGPQITELAKELGADLEIPFEARYNAAPSQSLPVIKDNAQKAVQMVQWGIIPFWADNKPNPQRLINARSETILEKATFKNLFKKQRCLVLADGYYEWQKVKGGKIPHRIMLCDEKPFVFAGIWDRHQGASDTPSDDFCIITTAAPASITEIHNRMPVILRQDYWQFWLSDTQDYEGLQELLAPYPDNQIKAFPIAKSVNNVANDSPELIEPV